MTDDASPESQDLARFFQDWTALWQEELRAQAADPETMAMWRTAMALWTSPHGGRDPGHRAAGAAGAAPVAAAPDPRDAEIERLARRVDELETRIVRLEAPRRRRG